MTDTYTPVLLRAFVEVPEDAANDASTIDVLRDNSDVVAHSENNVLAWMAYLPENCVKTMIQMGWEVPT